MLQQIYIDLYKQVVFFLWNQIYIVSLVQVGFFLVLHLFSSELITVLWGSRSDIEPILNFSLIKISVMKNLLVGLENSCLVDDFTCF